MKITFRMEDMINNLILNVIQRNINHTTLYKKINDTFGAVYYN